jgi:membrane-bound lytic murein transglycosylase B
VTYPAVVAADADLELVARSDFKPKLTLAELGAAGFAVQLPAGGGEVAVAEDTLAAVARLEEQDGYRYWITFDNFYVITRYNRSPLYAMAVHELSEAILAGYAQ